MIPRIIFTFGSSRGSNLGTLAFNSLTQRCRVIKKQGIGWYPAFIWRRVRDLNPRYLNRYTAFPVLLLRPLGQLYMWSNDDRQQPFFNCLTIIYNFSRKIKSFFKNVLNWEKKWNIEKSRRLYCRMITNSPYRLQFRHILFICLTNFSFWICVICICNRQVAQYC